MKLTASASIYTDFMSDLFGVSALKSVPRHVPPAGSEARKLNDACANVQSALMHIRRVGNKEKADKSFQIASGAVAQLLAV